MQNFRILSEGGKCPAKLSPKRTQHYVSIVLVLLKRNFLFFNNEHSANPHIF